MAINYYEERVMKQFFSLVILLSAFNSFAQERVLLNSKEVRINASEAILVRTSETPDDVKLNLQVPMDNQYCAETGMRQVSSICSRTVYRHGGQTVCVRRNPYNNVCLNSQTRYTEVPSRQTYSCLVPQSYCVRYDVGTSYEMDSVKIKFKKLPSLGGSEEETFLIRAQQKRLDSGNVVYEIIPQSTLGDYEVKDKGFLGSDKFVIQQK